MACLHIAAQQVLDSRPCALLFADRQNAASFSAFTDQQYMQWVLELPLHFLDAESLASAMMLTVAETEIAQLQRFYSLSGCFLKLGELHWFAPDGQRCYRDMRDSEDLLLQGMQQCIEQDARFGPFSAQDE
jgi:hypothetical protein